MMLFRVQHNLSTIERKKNRDIKSNKNKCSCDHP